MKLAKVLLFTVVYLGSTSIFAQPEQPKKSESQVEAQMPDSHQLALQVSKEMMQTEAFKLLVYTSVLSSKVGDVVEVSPAIQGKYNTIRNLVFASLPMSVVGAATVFLAQRSAKEFESVLAPVTALIKFLMNGLVESAKQVWKVSEALRIDKVLEQSGQSLKWSIEALEPILKIFISKGFGISVATVSGSATLGASSFLIWNSRAEGALNYATARSLLGYDRDVKRNVDAAVTDLSEIFSLNAKDEAQFKDALFDEVVKQAIDQKFDRRAKFNVDAVSLLSKKNIISPEQAAAANALRELTTVAMTRRTDKASDQELLIHNIDTVTALCAVLEAMVESGKLSESEEKEVRQLLGNAKRNLKIVQLNFKGLK